MPLPLDILRGKINEQEQRPRSNSNLGRLLAREGISESPEFRRVMDIPVSDWREVADPDFVHRCTAFLKKPEGQMQLQPVQAAALSYIHDYKGLFGVVVVGGGKTLISYLAPTVLESKRAVLLAPGGLETKTRENFAELSEHWRGPEVPMEFVSYETLGLEEYADILFKKDPDLLVADEFHKLSNVRDAGCAKRVREILADRLKQGRRISFVALSGTPMKRSLRDFNHILLWALPYCYPFPMPWNEFQDWADATDEDVDVFKRPAPGALLKMADWFGVDPNLDPLTRARYAIRRRLETCPGVILTDEDLSDVRLQIVIRKDVKPCETTKQHLQKLRNTWESPEGDLFTEAVQVWACAHEIVSGFTSYWDPPPPEEWFDSRRAWKSFVRFTLRHNRRRLFTEKQVEGAVKRGEYPEGRVFFDQWMSVKDMYNPKKHRKVRWHSDWMLEFCRNWLSQTPRGLVWTVHREFGRRFAQYANVPFFAQKGLDAKKRYIEHCRGEPCIASVKANSTGRNLQFGWSRSLFSSFPSTGRDMEQVLGRQHRQGQSDPVVVAEIVAASEEQEHALQRLYTDAKSIQDIGKQRQKLLYAETIVKEKQ